jgi:mRNA-degrading endonuclease RelE of RelBE toxin-antitoxin system
MFEAHYSENFKEQFRKLPASLQKKFLKQLKFLLKDFRHPSLRARKMAGLDRFEARIDKGNRFTYMVVGQEIWFLTIGPHDKGLGEK